MQKKKLDETPITDSAIKNVVRGPFYLCAVLVLFFSTTLILTAMFSSNWQKKTSIENRQEYFTYGLWFTCRHIKLDWLGNHDFYCSTTNFKNCKFNLNSKQCN